MKKLVSSTPKIKRKTTLWFLCALLVLLGSIGRVIGSKNIYKFGEPGDISGIVAAHHAFSQSPSITPSLGITSQLWSAFKSTLSKAVEYPKSSLSLASISALSLVWYLYNKNATEKNNLEIAKKMYDYVIAVMHSPEQHPNNLAKENAEIQSDGIVNGLYYLIASKKISKNNLNSLTENDPIRTTNSLGIFLQQAANVQTKNLLEYFFLIYNLLAMNQFRQIIAEKIIKDQNLASARATSLTQLGILKKEEITLKNILASIKNKLLLQGLNQFVTTETEITERISHLIPAPAQAQLQNEENH